VILEKKKVREILGSTPPTNKY